jgi:hypothetical protein
MRHGSRIRDLVTTLPRRAFPLLPCMIGVRYRIAQFPAVPAMRKANYAVRSARPLGALRRFKFARGTAVSAVGKSTLLHTALGIANRVRTQLEKTPWSRMFTDWTRKPIESYARSAFRRVRRS